MLDLQTSGKVDGVGLIPTIPVLGNSGLMIFV